ncbi:MAG: hypothetical protein B7Y45_13360 [Sphingomonas sp. 28-66-16]|nr:MAG: hypothetical protein B7Y45_13360 [Sphingomonas sp. 28-66-16]
MIDHYDWSGGREAMLRLGRPEAPLVLIAPALFEEANRTRALTLTVMRALADLGVASVLPDLPATGESLIDTSAARLADWESAYAALATQLSKTRRVHGAGIRGGALVDRSAALISRWHFAPVAGEALVRDMMRARQAAGREAGHAPDPADQSPDGPPIELAGNLVSRELLANLRAASPTSAGKVRTVRLTSDPMPSDHAVDGAPLWRRSEPGNDTILAAILAADLASWIAACGN